MNSSRCWSHSMLYLFKQLEWILGLELENNVALFTEGIHIQNEHPFLMVSRSSAKLQVPCNRNSLLLPSVRPTSEVLAASSPTTTMRY